MIRLLLIALALGMALLGGSAFVLHHFFGWWGLATLPVIVLALAFLGMKLGGHLFKRVLLGLFSAKSAVLRNAALRVHSIAAAAGPSRSDSHAADASEADDDSVATSEEDEDDPRDYVAVELTVTPAGDSGERVWEPGELILTTERLESLVALEDDSKEVGRVETCRVWNGTRFDDDVAGKYPGEQRLLLTFAVKPGVSRAWLQYYDVPVGSLDLPAPAGGGQAPRGG